METSLLTTPIAYEPIMSHRFIIETIGYEIPSYLFQNYKIFNEGEEIILTIEFIEIVNFCFNPKNFMDITDVNIQYIDPTGVNVHEILYGIKGSNFELENAYKNDNISTVKMRFIVDKNKIDEKYVSHGVTLGSSGVSGKSETKCTSGKSGIYNGEMRS